MELIKPHPLTVYFAESGTSVEEYASRAKLSASTIYSYLNGTRRPKRKLLRQLSKATNGKVTVRQLLEYYNYYAQRETKECETLAYM